MARTNLTIQSLPARGAVLNLTDLAQSVAAADGAKVKNDGTIEIWAISAGGGSVNVTEVIAQTSDDQTIPANVAAVANNKTVCLGRFPPGIYNQPSGADKGYLYLNVSGTVKLLAKKTS